MRAKRSTTNHQRWGGAKERARCVREAERYLQTADAEDAVQEAMLRAFRKGDAQIPATGPLPWLLAITRNEALRLLSSSRPTPIAESSEPGAEDPEIEGLALRMDIDRALGQLSAEDRVLLELCYLRGFSQRAVAEWLGIPEGTIWRRTHELRARLRAALESDDG